MPCDPPPAGRGQPQVAPIQPVRVALVLAVLAGLVNVPLDLWLRPHGVGYVLVMLASVAVSFSAGAAELVIPVPREENRNGTDGPAATRP